MQLCLPDMAVFAAPCRTSSVWHLSVAAQHTNVHSSRLLSGVRRELYLCDDGKDPTKRAWLETNYGDCSPAKGRVHYVSGRWVQGLLFFRLAALPAVMCVL